MRYDKLVRDKIPAILKKKGITPIVHRASEEEFGQRLCEKLREEVGELLAKPSEEELADVLEVLSALQSYYGFDEAVIERVRKEKARERGVFNEKLVLDETRVEAKEKV
ncbi:hypothetical protein D6789_02380 [Candidatus Woesearchaeota archaeon]|nr:MAG: hypothetical protein D6789_02380 [Candidatus Woesearchaeota archaeon]